VRGIAWGRKKKWFGGGGRRCPGGGEKGDLENDFAQDLCSLGRRGKVEEKKGKKGERLTFILSFASGTGGGRKMDILRGGRVEMRQQEGKAWREFLNWEMVTGEGKSVSVSAKAVL